jgi:hypothetical protein
LIVYVQRWTKIVDDITQQIEGLQVTFGGQLAPRNVVRVTAFLRNVGNVDIDRSDVHEPLTISLPGQSRWLRAHLSAGRIKCDGKIDGSKLTLTWDMIRKRERIQIDGLFEFAPADNRGMSIAEILVADGRIKNTKIETLKEIQDQPTPLMRGSSGDLIYIALYLWSVSAYMHPTVGLELLNGDKVVKTFVSDEGKVCAAPNYNEYLRLIPFYPQPHTCAVELPEKFVNGSLSVRPKKSAAQVFGTVMYAILTAVLVFAVGLRVSSRYLRQRRRFDRISWFRQSKE